MGSPIDDYIANTKKAKLMQAHQLQLNGNGPQIHAQAQVQPVDCDLGMSPQVEKFNMHKAAQNKRGQKRV